MNYADIKKVDVANGVGVRVSLFVSGCNHHCKGCFNPETWDFEYGKKFDENAENEILNYLENDYITGLTLLGGEPLEYRNQVDLLPFIRKVKKRFPNKNIWCYTGFRFENDVLERMCQNWEETKELISYIDVLVDGRFMLDLKDAGLKFRGSRNQRIIDVKKSLEENETILLEI